jgi:hypothetical protein
LAAEEKGQRDKPKSAGQKKAEKKTSNAPSKGTLNLDQLDQPSGERPDSASDNKKLTTLNASGIDNALDALSLTTPSQTQQIERHPERRFKAAFAAYQDRRLPELEAENPGLRRNQRIELLRKEFEKSPENPFNQVSVKFDAGRDEVKEVKRQVQEGVEGRLGEK